MLKKFFLFLVKEYKDKQIVINCQLAIKLIKKYVHYFIL